MCGSTDVNIDYEKFNLTPPELSEEQAEREALALTLSLSRKLDSVEQAQIAAIATTSTTTSETRGLQEKGESSNPSNPSNPGIAKNTENSENEKEKKRGEEKEEDKDKGVDHNPLNSLFQAWQGLLPSIMHKRFTPISDEDLAKGDCRWVLGKV